VAKLRAMVLGIAKEANVRKKVCEFGDCQNVQRSKGLCRGHGGGKRCQHSGCDKGGWVPFRCTVSTPVVINAQQVPLNSAQLVEGGNAVNTQVVTSVRSGEECATDMVSKLDY
jgi:hypothetical protein